MCFTHCGVFVIFIVLNKLLELNKYHQTEAGDCLKDSPHDYNYRAESTPVDNHALRISSSIQ